MKGDSLYWITARLLDVLIWGGELVNEEDLPAAGPAVFVSNHADAMGPIAIASSLPIRIYPWVIADMLEWGKAADYLRKDFVEPQLHIPAPLSVIVSKLISQASVRLLRSVGSIPAWHGEEVVETYRISVDHLIRGGKLLIFPEDPTQPKDELHKMRPFKKGFTRLGELYYTQTNKILRFYPLAVHPQALKVKVGKPISFNPLNDRIKERLRIKNVLESMIRELYLNMILESHMAIPLPH